MKKMLIDSSWAQPSNPTTDGNPDQKFENNLLPKHSRLMSIQPDGLGIQKIKDYMTKKGL